MASLVEWQPNTWYGVNAVAISPFGELIRCNTQHQSGATYASTNWGIIAGRAQSGTTTAAAGANAGTSPPAPVVSGTADDMRGNITAGTGTTPAAGAQVVVTFGRAYDAVPVVMVDGANQATAALGVGVSNVTTTGFTIVLGTAPAASQANTVYSYNYLVRP